MAGRPQTAPPHLRRSKDDTAHPHQPGARPDPPRPAPARSGRHSPAKAKVRSPLRNRIRRAGAGRGTAPQHHGCAAQPFKVTAVVWERADGAGRGTAPQHNVCEARPLLGYNDLGEGRGRALAETLRLSTKVYVAPPQRQFDLRSAKEKEEEAWTELASCRPHAQDPHGTFVHIY